jgi:hypothetical protein
MERPTLDETALSLYCLVQTTMHKSLGQGCQIFLDTIYQNVGKYTKLLQNYQITIKCKKCPWHIPNGHKKYTNIFHSKALQNLPKFGFLVGKNTIWQSWFRPECFAFP